MIDKKIRGEDETNKQKNIITKNPSHALIDDQLYIDKYMYNNWWYVVLCILKNKNRIIVHHVYHNECNLKLINLHISNT